MVYKVSLLAANTEAEVDVILSKLFIVILLAWENVIRNILQQELVKSFKTAFLALSNLSLYRNS